VVRCTGAPVLLRAASGGARSSLAVRSRDCSILGTPGEVDDEAVDGGGNICPGKSCPVLGMAAARSSASSSAVAAGLAPVPSGMFARRSAASSSAVAAGLAPEPGGLFALGSETGLSSPGSMSGLNAAVGSRDARIRGSRGKLPRCGKLVLVCASAHLHSNGTNVWVVSLRGANIMHAGQM
jgi:hypothetical protein